MTVLVLTRDADATADLVIAELNHRGVRVHRLDPGSFPQVAGLSAYIGPYDRRWAGSLKGQHQDTAFDRVTSVYYRRPSPFRFTDEMSEADARWAESEARAGFGVLTTLPCPWINHPHRNAVASVTPIALATAARCGLTVPKTLITNSPDDARDFVKALPDTVAAYKALGSRSPTEIDGQPHALWTTQVRPEDIDDSVTLTAHQFQEWVPKVFEVRLTVVGTQMFAARIRAGSEASRIDFRSDYDSLTYGPCVVPERVRDGVRKLMSEFGLRYSALDFLVNKHGHWYLVDVNPNGQWAFVPFLREPITQAIADLLERPTP
ncbi:ATP-grasp ribosomal peptide maturase [Streptomyces buecherae]|uniref:ATP-grasp ribosomal peptide maturase n=1 Tax=Streptomyces buecherae TaxID=2763006 RepID=A0A7H8N302_9ACTN|nr:ATP-grasp ribosomal peptide maturase [Streptomyces buecherae]QKW48894.1 ATP-grasp ribosomal peptide maturase [Streptomyces buecherae]